MARDVAGLALGMELLEPGFAKTLRPASDAADLVVGRLVLPADPLIDAALDLALEQSGWSHEAVVLPEWDDATAAAGLLLVVEAYESDGALLAADRAGIGADVRERLVQGRDAEPAAVRVGPGGPAAVGG